MKEIEQKINLLIEDYQRRINTITDAINQHQNDTTGSINDTKKGERLITKRSEWQTFLSELSALRAEQGEKGETARVGRDEWIRFEDKLPLEGQEIMLTWPSGNYHPEYRKVTKDMLKGDLSLLRWIPIPKY